ncbi:Metallothionein expression activator [Elasticomyces elasticus]|uniref:Metallothionein expression activator n=1 Tax=Elasticomyces elasticus TaxID=574655 RepID=A0AAN7ZUP6_9PEZI|nr:Metallothionein expression activator [Elasticomyces elasticus]
MAQTVERNYHLHEALDVRLLDTTFPAASIASEVESALVDIMTNCSNSTDWSRDVHPRIVDWVRRVVCTWQFILRGPDISPDRYIHVDELGNCFKPLHETFPECVHELTAVDEIFQSVTTPYEDYEAPEDEDHRIYDEDDEDVTGAYIPVAVLQDIERAVSKIYLRLVEIKPSGPRRSFAGPPRLYLTSGVTSKVATRVSRRNGIAAQEPDIRAGEHVYYKGEICGSILDTNVTIAMVDAYIDELPVAEKKYACLWEECNHKAGSQANMFAHVQVHLDDRRYQCNKCGQRFVRKQYLSSHGDVHRDEKPYICPCGSTFLREFLWFSIIGMGHVSILGQRLRMGRKGSEWRTKETMMWTTRRRRRKRLDGHATRWVLSSNNYIVLVGDDTLRCRVRRSIGGPPMN